MVTIWASRRRPYSCAAAAEHCAPVPRRDGRLAEEASVSEPDIMFRDPRRTVDFGKTFVGSDGFKALFREGMLLVEDTAAYLDGPGRDESKALSRHAALTYASESMRLTTRPMQIASWLWCSAPSPRARSRRARRCARSTGSASRRKRRRARS